MEKTAKPLLFRGVSTALVTPFHNGEVDYTALRLLIQAQTEAGIDSLTICGTTGEASSLTEREHAEMIAFAAELVDGRIPLIAGCGSPCTAKAKTLIENACKNGADGVLVVTPYYNKCSQEGLYRHYMTLADAAEKPLLMYEVPTRTGVRILPETYARLAEHENIVGVKDASDDLSHTAAVLTAVGNRLAVYCGSDALTVPMLALGAVGVISVLSNAEPSGVHTMCRLWFEGKTEASAAMQLRYTEKIKALFSEVNPIPVKAVLAARGQCKEEYRLPLCPMADMEKAALLRIFSEAQ